MGSETRFISDFVNAVYAIILGFGLVEIMKSIFSSNIALRITIDNLKFFQLTMAFFVIVVICLYWWDWSENIEYNVKSTFPEFIIDMGILFTLLMILFKFDNPLTLSKLFFILSFWNLIWVVNYLRENSKGERLSFWKLKWIINLSSELKKGELNWVGQKILALFFYILAWYSISEVSQLEKISGQKFLTSIPLFVSFILVRHFCFKGRPIDKPSHI